MSDPEFSQATQIVNAIAAGDRSGADRLFSLLYSALRDLASRYLRGEKPDHTLSPTDLVHEAYIKLIDQTKVEWRGKTHFLAIGAQAMRRILVDHARYKHRAKRGGGRVRIQLNEQVALSPQRDEDLLALDETLVKLAEVDPRQAAIVELRFFGGLNVAEVAEVLGVSKRTVENEWTAVRAWLRRELADPSAES
jgi:RNA polymerase sigma-70 factor, ECF subfamily